MMKRVTWFVGGVAAGAAGAGYAKKKIRTQAAKLAPGNVAKGAVAKVRQTGQHVVSALRDGREAMHDKEDELRAIRDADELPVVERRESIVLDNVHEIRHPREPRPSHRDRPARQPRMDT